MSKKELPVDADPQEPESEPSSFFPEKGPGLGKEVKIGLAILTVLMTIFAVVVVKKLRGPAASPPVAEEAGAKTDGQTAEKLSAKDLFGNSSSAKSTAASAIPAKPGTASPASLGGGKWSTASDTSRWKDVTYENRSEPAPSHFPKLDAGPAPGGGQMTTGISVGNSQQPFDPFPKSPSALGAQGAGTAGSLAPAGTAASATPSRDASGMAALSDGARPLASGTGQAVGNMGNTVPTYGSLPSQTPAYAGSPPTGYRAVPDPSIAPSPTATAAGYALPDANSGLQRVDGAAARRADGTYVVRPSDNYYAISLRLYGTGSYYKALAEHNRKKYPDENRLTVNDVISAPPAAELERNYADLCPKPEHRRLPDPSRNPITSASAGVAGGRLYVVQAGDNLFHIAKYELQSPARWVEIYELNRDILGDHVDHLKPGMKLALPGTTGAPTARTAVQGPDSSMRR